jgi:hypothetical protein
MERTLLANRDSARFDGRASQASMSASQGSKIASQDSKMASQASKIAALEVHRASRRSTPPHGRAAPRALRASVRA